jgi:Uma2 family endonuclease
MVLQERLYTVDEFLEFINRPGFEGKRIELHEGVVVELPPSSRRNVFLEAWLIILLANFFVPRNLGIISPPDAGYKIDGHNYLQPDVAFISKERAGGLEGVEFLVAPIWQ